MAVKNTEIQKKTINVGGRLLDFSEPRVMGILNITPDSFYAGSRTQTIEKVLETAAQMLAEGASIIDVGAYSSRPGATDISGADEMERLLPVVKALSKQFPAAILSVDTFRAAVAGAAIEEGAHLINDISAGDLDPRMVKTVARLKVPYIIMHMKGTPQTMKQLANYEDVVKDVMQYLSAKLQYLRDSGLYDVIIDPGFGFAKTIEHNYEILNQLEIFKLLGVPVLAGLSRKSMIWKVLDIHNDEALNGTTVLNTVALMKGANILRVHDVKAAVEAVALVKQLLNANSSK